MSYLRCMFLQLFDDSNQLLFHCSNTLFGRTKIFIKKALDPGRKAGSVCKCELGCVVRMVVDSILPHAESGPNDQRKDAPPFTSPLNVARISLNFEQNSHVK